MCCYGLISSVAHIENIRTKMGKNAFPRVTLFYKVFARFLTSISVASSFVQKQKLWVSWIHNLPSPLCSHFSQIILADWQWDFFHDQSPKKLIHFPIRAFFWRAEIQCQFLFLKHSVDLPFQMLIILCILLSKLICRRFDSTVSINSESHSI